MPLTRNPASRPSLVEVQRSIRIPDGSSFWRKMLAYAGPGYFVPVGSALPDNWDTDIAGIANFDYTFTTSARYSPETSRQTGGFQA
jgi:manganese transport protein